MKIEFKDKEEARNPTLDQLVEPDTDLKNWLVEYIGEKNNPENQEVTVAMIVETMADEFPEFLMAVAEENWIRGYQQAFSDIHGNYGSPSEKTPEENTSEDEQQAQHYTVYKRVER